MERESRERDVVFRERVEVEPGGTLCADLDIGELTIESHDESAVAVEASASGSGKDRVAFSLEKEDDEVYLNGSVGEWFGRRREGRGVRFDVQVPRVRVRVRIPRSFSVDAHTTAGPIRVRDVGGEVTAEAGAGPIDVDRVSGPVSARTLGGPVSVDEAGGDVRARTLGGPVRVRGVRGDAELRTVGGPIHASHVDGRVVARAGAGPITVHFGARPAGSLETAAGAIDVRLPEGVGAELDAAARLGRVAVDRAIEFRGRRSSSEVVGRIEDGGEPLRMRTSIGAIQVRQFRQARHESEHGDTGP